MAEETMSTTQNAPDNTEATSTETAKNESTEVKETTQNESKEVDFEKLIQKAVDRATNKLGNENKKLREQLDAIKKEKLSEEELKKLKAIKRGEIMNSVASEPSLLNDLGKESILI